MLRAAMRRSSAQKFCLVFGWTLVLAGLAGFLVDAGFKDGDPVQGDLLLGLEVNGWHNLVHIASGLLLLSGVGRHRRARTIALVFAIAYLTVTIMGFGSSEILDVVPVNSADNWLHLALTVLAFLVALRSRPTDRRESALHPSSWETSRASGRARPAP